MVQVNVQRRDDELSQVVLHGGETLGKFPDVVVIENRERCRGETATADVLGGQIRPDQVAQGFRTRSVSAPTDLFVESG